MPKEKYKAAQKRYHQSSEGKAAQKRYNQSEKGKVVHKRYQQSEKGKAARRTAKKNFNARNPNYVKAKAAVNNAVRDGKLPGVNTLLCSYCPNPAQQYHHPSYEPEHWLDVLPACIKCHKNIHKDDKDVYPPSKSND